MAVMFRLLVVLNSTIVLFQSIFAHVLPLERRVDSYCENSASNRSCWGNYSIYTDYYSVEESPNTGVIREYWLEIVNITLAPDGFERQVLCVNGTIPGPNIWANWGDEIKVHVTNKLEDNGTSIHWHAQTQLNTNDMDGVPGVTQTPIPPGGNFTYHFKADHYGQSWYHSHFSLQYIEGVLGPLTVYGPTSANYDVDLGPLMLEDWRHLSAFKVMRNFSHSGLGAGAVLENAVNLLLNGTNVFNNSGTIIGAHLNVTVEPGKKYKMGLVGSCGENSVYFSIDKHNFTIVSTDYTPIQPVVVDHIFVTPGQRYEIIFEASLDVDNYWIRAEPAVLGHCAFNLHYEQSGLGVLRYAGAPLANPVTEKWEIQENCLDLPASMLEPVLFKEVPVDLQADFVYGMITNHWNTSGPSRSQLFYIQDQAPAVARGFGPPPGAPQVPGALNTTNATSPTTSASAPAFTDPGKLNATIPGENSFMIDYSNPTLGIVENHAWFGSNLSYPPSYNVYTFTQKDQWVYFVIQTPGGIAHPMHLHGHDFYILSQSPAQFTNTTAVLDGYNPVRRDTAMCPPGGSMVLAWKTDNPGCWMFHCHIAWHIALGLGLQFVERPDDIPDTLGIAPSVASPWYQNTLNWESYDRPPVVIDQDDAGI
ncbi:hypothetical protein YB2330_006583 [Saitoella coloradoensis]